jgi:pimeloyl-ACP methyl ester carboxylesterase
VCFWRSHRLISRREFGSNDDKRTKDRGRTWRGNEQGRVPARIVWEKHRCVRRCGSTPATDASESDSCSVVTASAFSCIFSAGEPSVLEFAATIGQKGSATLATRFVSDSIRTAQGAVCAHLGHILEGGEMTSRVLFLHGGPGLSAALERRRWGHLPVHWWDQPQISSDTLQPYEQLVVASHAELARLYELDRTPVPLLASSFGAHLALTLMERAPEQIGAVSIVAGILDVRAALVQLGRRMAERTGDASLALASESAARDVDSVWRLIEQLFGLPGLLECYWSSGAQAQCQEMLELAAADHLLHAPTFQSVLREVFLRPLPSAPRGWHAPVSVWLGRHDPYVLELDAETWKQRLPGAQVRWVDAGHFPHLELDPSLWMPTACIA